MKRMKQMWCRAAVISFVVLLALVGFAGCGDKGEAAEESSQAVVLEEVEEPEPQPEPYYWPLTGIEYGQALPGEEDDFYYPLSIKIENTPEARPQLGIARADVVYESVTEGGITRFNCLFQSDIPDYVGPVRSARNSDISIVPEYDGILFFSGTNSDVWASLGQTTIKNMPADIGKGGTDMNLYKRESVRPIGSSRDEDGKIVVEHGSGGVYSPHNLYLEAGDCYEWAAAYWEKYAWSPVDGNPNRLMFGDLDPSFVTEEVTEVYMPFSTGTFNPTWVWSAADNAFLREVDGKPFEDADPASGQVKANNVVILWAPHVLGPFIENKGNPLHINLAGSGEAQIFRDGVAVKGKWTTDGTVPPRFVDDSGKEIFLSPGTTWFQVLDTDKIPTITGPGGTVTEGTEEEVLTPEEQAAAEKEAATWDVEEAA
ncbi:MAG: DUF3048 domain-containing protein [Clostridiales Family XIII bacterium]|jgi:hypothetical protein|nr:DUF3048 domain-containing protein [Clostridiales Family XIII bacterium]